MRHPTARRLYVESQERHVRALLEAQLAQHQARLEALRRRQRESADYEVGVAVWWRRRAGWLAGGLAVGAAAAAAHTPRC